MSSVGKNIVISLLSFITVLASTCAGISAIVVIDTLTLSEVDQSYNTASFNITQTGIDDDFVIGGARYISGTRTGGTGYDVELGGGVLELNQGVSAIGMTWILEYGHGFDLNADLSGAFLADGSGRGILMEAAADHAGASLQISLYTTGGGSSTVTHNFLDATVTESMEYLFFDFDNDFVQTGGGADLSNIDRINFRFVTTLAGTDIQINLLQAGSIPEPQTAVMMLMACGALFSARRKFLHLQAA